MFSSLTDEELQELRNDYLQALKAISTGQNYSIEGMSVSRADLAEVKKTFQQISTEINNRATTKRGGRVGVMTPKWS